MSSGRSAFELRRPLPADRCQGEDCRVRARDRLRRPARSIALPQILAPAQRSGGQPGGAQSARPSTRGCSIENIWRRVLSNRSGFSCQSTRRGRYASANGPEADTRCAHDCCLVAVRAVGARLPLPTAGDGKEKYRLAGVEPLSWLGVRERDSPRSPGSAVRRSGLEEFLEASQIGFDHGRVAIKFGIR